MSAAATLLAIASPSLRLRQQELLRDHTTYQVGGPAALWVDIADAAQVMECLTLCRSHGMPIAVLGNGSNVIAPDQGLDALVLHLGQDFGRISARGDDELDVDAGTTLESLALHAAALRRAGFEWMVDIPGTLGGAILMNAGNNEGVMQQHLRRVRSLDVHGRVHERAVAELDLGYRRSRFQGNGEIILGATLVLGPHDAAVAIAARMESQRSTRRAKFPLQYPNAGSVFRRPPGRFAGQLIESAGLKGRRVGDAEVSTQHAGFIVNRGAATATDLVTLIRQVQAEVLHKHGVALELEQVQLEAHLLPAAR